MRGLITLLFSCFMGLGLCKQTFTIDERWVCNIKSSCLDCLRLPHCSWCEAQNKCFSKSLQESEDFCKDNATHLVDYGMSLEGNAKCACFGNQVERKCYPPGVTEGPECSNRGKCECGRCVCDPTPDPEHHSKIIVGEFCEYDNFSCDGPRCNEGPYHINHVEDDEE